VRKILIKPSVSMANDIDESNAPTAALVHSYYGRTRIAGELLDTVFPRYGGWKVLAVGRPRQLEGML
jgi:hypothetical protein